MQRPQHLQKVNFYLLCDFFGDRMFNLESGVHLYEVVFAVFIHQELHSSCVLVSNLQQEKITREQFYSS